MQIDDDTAKVLDALVPSVAFDGWTSKALGMALRALGRNPAEAGLLFPGGAGEMIEAYFALGDQRMIAAAQRQPPQGGLTARVRAIITLRLEQMAGEKEAVRRALAWLALPAQAPRLARVIAATADAIWFAAGDKSADFSWYTKRASLGAIYLATLLYWLADGSEGGERTLAFLDRRLAGAGRIAKLRQRLGKPCGIFQLAERSTA
jgi:ubiquinone biosynthesis protein COQ9